jgi:hypothetical protein
MLNVPCREVIMKFQVVKWWPMVPEARQPATQEKHTSREAAEIEAQRLRDEMPSRRFGVVPIREEGGKNESVD